MQGKTTVFGVLGGIGKKRGSHRAGPGGQGKESFLLLWVQEGAQGCCRQLVPLCVGLQCGDDG